MTVASSLGTAYAWYAQVTGKKWFARLDDTLKRLAEPADVGAAVLAVAAYMPHTTGAIIPVDGGRLLT